MESSIVIKVKYQDTLRRFNTRLVNEELDLNMDGLREKIVSLFKFAPDTQLHFTYNDEDNDVVALVDDEDLRDVVRQALNPLRITVSTSTVKSLNSAADSSEDSTPLQSSPLQEKLQNLNLNVSEILKSLPEPIREPLSKLSSDLAKKASTYAASDIAEISGSLSNLGLHYLNQLSKLPSTGESKNSVEAYKDSDDLNNLVVPTELTTGASSEKPTSSENKKVLQQSKSSFKNDGNNLQGVFQSPELKSSLAASGSGNANSSQPVHPVVPKARVASNDKQEVKETGQIAGVKYFGGPPVANKGSSSGIDNSIRFGSLSGSNPTSSAEGWKKKKAASDLHYSSVPPVSSTSLNEYPFTGMPIINDTPTPHDDPSEMPERICKDINGIFHRGIVCDGCNVHPIRGPRFKSKVREDYDLCSICFAEMGNDADYMRIDHPVVHRYTQKHRGRLYTRTLPQRFKCHGAESAPLKLDSRFSLDVNILDGTVMPPLTPFTKIWRMRNNGTTVWPQGTRLVWIGGFRMTMTPSVELEISEGGLQVGQELDVAADFVAPELHGRHISYWRMALPTGQKFGQRVWVLIEVDASVEKPTHAAIPGLNLNLFPGSEIVTAPEVDVPFPEPIMDQSLPEPNMSNASIETVDAPIPEATVEQSLPEPKLPAASVETSEPVVNGKVSKEQEAKFPIDDSLLVGGIKYNDWQSGQSSSVSYPIIDLPEEIEPFLSAASGMAILASDEVNADGQNQEEELLKELEEMGFKQASLNKELLKKHKYDLEKTVDDLCGDSEWDPILEELEEMGFYDRDNNKRLLRKNDGSIKRVVMDLIAGEAE